jgi:chloramphenicol O-acetyltransferase type B
VIGHDVWIGLGAVILSGVNIGNGAVIGASAMVTKNVLAYSIVVGNPGKIIGTRFSDEEINILEELCWWFWRDEKLDASINFLLNQDILSLKSFSEEYDLKYNRK